MFVAGQLLRSQHFQIAVIAISAFAVFTYMRAEEGGWRLTEEGRVHVQDRVYNNASMIEGEGFVEPETGNGVDVAAGYSDVTRHHLQHTVGSNAEEENQSVDNEDYVVTNNVGPGSYAIGNSRSDSLPAYAPVNDRTGASAGGAPASPVPVRAGSQSVSSPERTAANDDSGRGDLVAGELSPEEINPFLPDGSVAEPEEENKISFKCPTFITGAMKTRYSYTLLESMGCNPSFDY